MDVNPQKLVKMPNDKIKITKEFYNSVVEDMTDEQFYKFKKEIIEHFTMEKRFMNARNILLSVGVVIILFSFILFLFV